MRAMLRPAVLRSLSTSVRWAAAGGLVLLCFALRWWLFGPTPVLPFLLFFPAIIVSAVVFDRGSGLFATGLSAALALYHFVPPARSLAIPNTETFLSIALFVAVGLFIAIAVEALHVAVLEGAEAREAAEHARARAEAGERELRLLLDEFSHRVKNDLARITATLGIQAADAPPEVAGALRAAADRVQVVARVHDRLAWHDGQTLTDVHDFLLDLVADLRRGIGGLSPVILLVEAERHLLPATSASAVGLIVNELVTNALKHAFPDDREGAVRIAFRREGEDYLIAVADDGAGLPPMPEPELRDELAARGRGGRRLVRALAAQLGGRVETAPSGPAGGVTQILRIPVRLPEEAGVPA